MCVDNEYYYPTYVNRFRLLGPLINMWFKPLQAIFGDLVNYDDSEGNEEPEEDKKLIEYHPYDGIREENKSYLNYYAEAI